MDEGVSEDNCIWANTKVTSGCVQGLVIYTGNQTKTQLNQNTARFKLGKVDREVNWLIILTVCFMVILAFIMTL